MQSKWDQHITTKKTELRKMIVASILKNSKNEATGMKTNKITCKNNL